METQTKNLKSKAGEMSNCIHYENCKKWNLLTCEKPNRKPCRDFTGKIIKKGLLYRCTCGYTDTVYETDDGHLVCQTCGAHTSFSLQEED